MPTAINLAEAKNKARELYFGQYDDASKVPGQHAAEGPIAAMLLDSLVSSAASTRLGRTRAANGRDLWDPRKDLTLVDNVNKLKDSVEVNLSTEELLLRDSGLLQFDDQFTAERVRDLRTEVLTMYSVGLISPQTNIVNNFFRTIQADAGDTLSGIKEYINMVETYSDFEYYQIDPQRGDIRSIDVNRTTASDRINPHMAMYGVKVEYENFLYRVLANTNIADLIAMTVVGWSKASAMAREFDASTYLTNYIDPTPIFDNNRGGVSALGQLSGVGINGIQNGTFDPDYDFPRMQAYMEDNLQMQTNNLIMLMPRNGWPFMSMRKGYHRFLTADGSPIYQRPTVTQGPREALPGADRYGLRIKGVGYNGPDQAREYLTGGGEALAGRLAGAAVPGPMPFLPENVPNAMNSFTLPNSLFGGMRVVLSPFISTKHRYYAEETELRFDDVTEEKRAVTTTDIMFFDGNHPLYLIETIPPTSWTATNEEYRKSVLVMVEAYAMANSARGQQAATIKGAVLDDNYKHEIRLDAKDVKITDKPLGDGMQRF